MRRLAGEVVDDLHILPAGVENLQHVFVVAHQIEKGGQIDPVGERVDCCCLFLVRDLHQAQFRPVGIFAHELGIDGNEVGFRQALAQFGELVGGGNQVMYLHRSFLSSGGVPPLGLPGALTKLRACPVSARDMRSAPFGGAPLAP